MHNPKLQSSSVLDQPDPQPKQVHSHDNYPSSDNTPQDVDKSCHASDSTSTTDSLDDSSTLIGPDDHLLQLDSTSLSSQLHDTSSIEIVFVSKSEGHLDHANPSQTDVFLEHHDYELFLLDQEIDTPSDNLSHQGSHNCEKLCQDDTFLTHVTNFSLTFAIPHFMAQHNCEDLSPTDTPSTVPTFTKASSGYELNPTCAHNLFSSQVIQDKSYNSMVSLCVNFWEHLLKKSGGDTSEDNYPVNWFKFISSMSSKTVITGP